MGVSSDVPDGEADKAQTAGPHKPTTLSADVLTLVKPEEVVFVLANPQSNEGYLVYALLQGSASEGGKPFALSVVQASQVPAGLEGFLLDKDAVPPSHLRPPHQVHVVVSTGSGLRRAPDFYDIVLRPLLQAVGSEAADPNVPESATDGRYRLLLTRDANTIRDYARELGRDRSATERTIVLLSGDGGLVDLLNGLEQAGPAPSSSPPPTVALLPLGTANALFHSLHKPQYAEQPASSPLVLALRTLFRGCPASLPTFRASFSPGARLAPAPLADPDLGPDTDSGEPKQEAEGVGARLQPQPVTHLVGAIVASYGFHASLVWESDTPAYRVHGDKRFGMAAAELLKVAHGYDAVVQVRRREPDAHWGEGGEFASLHAPSSSATTSSSVGRLHVSRGGERYSYVLATLVSNLERTFTISPASRPLDGRLRLVWFGDVGGEKTMEIMMAAYREGEHVGMSEVVGYEEVDEVKVTINEEHPRWRKVCVDGTIVEVERGGWMSVRREPAERAKILV